MDGDVADTVVQKAHKHIICSHNSTCIVDDSKTHNSTCIVDDSKTHNSTCIVDDNKTHNSILTLDINFKCKYCSSKHSEALGIINIICLHLIKTLLRCS